MNRLSTLAAALSVIVFSTACAPKSDSDSQADAEDVSLAGFWRLSGTSESYDIVVDDSGRYMAFNGNGLLTGNSTESIYQSGNTVYASGYACSLSRGECGTLSYELDIDSSTELSGTVTDGIDTGNVSARKITSMDTEVTLADIANKTWVSTTNATATLVIYSDGSLQGTLDDGSAYTANVKDTGQNAFNFTAQAAISGTTYTIPGMAYVDSSDRLVSGGVLRNGDEFLMLYYIATVQ